jgi:hypothetical protein
MLVPSRRSLILGAGCLIASPMIVRAASFDKLLRGVPLDPKVIGFVALNQYWSYSYYNLIEGHTAEWHGKQQLPANFGLLKVEQKVALLNSTSIGARWITVRRSELQPNNFIKVI